MKKTGATRMLSKTIDVGGLRCSAVKAARLAGHFDIEIDYVAAL
ncbi:hypothetical protein [Bradyrhizobium retamae]|nr:hypothetical protein [Bradyrhizobium retamae]